MAPDNIRKGGDAKDRLAKNDRYGFFGERGENRLDLPYVEIARAAVGVRERRGRERGRVAVVAAVGESEAVDRAAVPVVHRRVVHRRGHSRNAENISDDRIEEVSTIDLDRRRKIRI